jgi:hypothetical protein
VQRSHPAPIDIIIPKRLHERRSHGFVECCLSALRLGGFDCNASYAHAVPSPPRDLGAKRNHGVYQFYARPDRYADGDMNRARRANWTTETAQRVWLSPSVRRSHTYEPPGEQITLRGLASRTGPMVVSMMLATRVSEIEPPHMRPTKYTHDAEARCLKTRSPFSPSVAKILAERHAANDAKGLP